MVYTPYPYGLFQEINRIIQWQSEKLIQLEQDVAQLKERLETLQTAPTNYVEKIEYNFEQLKVENLNGTLVIGLSPNDTGNVENVWIKDHYTENITLGASSGEPMVDEIQTEVDRYIRDDIVSLLPKKATAKNIILSDEQIKSIVDDMVRQCGDRIRFYIQQFGGGKSGKDVSERKHHIIQKMKDDLTMAIEPYIDHFRKEDPE